MDVLVGQVYRDKDKRMISGNRRVRVLQVRTDNKAVCSDCDKHGIPFSDRQTVIAVKNLRKRFELVERV